MASTFLLVTTYRDAIIDVEYLYPHLGTNSTTWTPVRWRITPALPSNACSFLAFEHRDYGAHVYVRVSSVCMLPTLSGWKPWLKEAWSPIMVWHVDRQIVTDVSVKRSAYICRINKMKISLWSCKIFLTSWHGRTQKYSTLRIIGRNYCKKWGRHMDIGVKKRRDIKFIYLAGCSTFPHLPAPISQLSYLFLPFVSVLPVFFY